MEIAILVHGFVVDEAQLAPWVVLPVVLVVFIEGLVAGSVTPGTFGVVSFHVLILLCECDCFESAVSTSWGVRLERMLIELGVIHESGLAEPTAWMSNFLMLGTVVPGRVLQLTPRTFGMCFHNMAV